MKECNLLRMTFSALIHQPQGLYFFCNEDIIPHVMIYDIKILIYDMIDVRKIMNQFLINNSMFYTITFRARDS